MKKLALVLFILLAASGLWWWESPRLATENLIDAAQDGDVAELEELIDPVAFDASLRSELHGRNQEPRVSEPSDTRQGRALGRLPADPLLVRLAGGAELIALRAGARTEWDIERRRLNTFRVVRRTGKDEPLSTLLFARDGLGWRLVGVDLPAGTVPAP